MPNEQGELIAVPFDATLEGYLEYLERQHKPTIERPPAISVSSVELTGEALTDFVTLQARLTVEVAGEAAATRFALGFPEAVIQERPRVRSAGRATFGGRDPDRGYIWWLDGAGVYEFQLVLAVPIRKVSPWRRLQLTVPASPVTSLRLKLPTVEPQIKLLPEEVVWEKIPQEDGRTEVHVSGFGSRLDLSWQPLRQAGNQPASLDANTTILVRGAAEGLFIEATQTVRALQGVFRDVEIRLPDQSELLQVDGPDIVETTVDPEEQEQVRLSLAAATAGPVTFHWRVRVPQSPRKRMVLNGFSVESAKRQSGTLGLVEVEDSRWSVVEAGEPHLERMAAGEFRLTTSVPVVRAYRFYAQPFRLPLTLESVAAYYDVTPVQALYAAEDEVRLEGRYQVHTFRGKVNQLTLLWPGWRSEGWVLDAIEPRGSVVTGFTSEAEGAEGRIQINLADQLPETFELRFSARRTRRPDEETRLTLPLLERPAGSGGVLDTEVLLFSAVNVDADLVPRGEAVLRSIPATRSVESEAFNLEPGLRYQSYRLQTEERQFALRVTPQAQRVRVSTSTLVNWTSQRLEIRETIRHQVEYARLNDVALIVPAEIADRVTFRYAGRELLPEWTEGRVAQERIAWLTLPTAKLGAVAIDLEWTLPLGEQWAGDRPLKLSIALARSDFARSEQNLIEVQRPAWFGLSTSDPQWLLQHADDDHVRWQTAAEVREFPLSVEILPQAVRAPFQITRAAIRAEFDARGAQNYRLQARLSGQGSELSLHLPARSSAPEVWWGALQLSKSQLLELPAGSRRYTVRLPELPEAGGEQLLTVDYQIASQGPLGHSARLTAVAPQLPQCEWSAQVLWEIHLPIDQYLWTPPDAAAALYHWQRNGWYWRRVWTSQGDDVRSWLRSNLPGPPDEAPIADGHVYAFRQLGAAGELRFRTLSAPMALLCGAGFSLVVGFVALRFAWIRSLLVVMGALCALAVSALWILPELELLFQPMALGAAFPLLIALAEMWSRRRALRAAWTLTASVSDFRSSSGEVPPTQSLQPAHADSATIFRAPVTGEPNPPRVTAESHAG